MTRAWFLAAAAVAGCAADDVHLDVPTPAGARSLFVAQRGGLDLSVELIDLSDDRDAPLFERRLAEDGDPELTLLFVESPAAELCIDPGPLPRAQGGQNARSLPSDGTVFGLIVEADGARWVEQDSLPAAVARFEHRDPRMNERPAVASCGDGLLCDVVEPCDDGNAVDDDECTNDCKLGCGLIETIALGNQTTFALARDGTLIGFGVDENGLGAGDGFPHEEPLTIEPRGFWRQIVPGAAHTIALARDGSLWTWGPNHRGELGRDANALSGRRPGRVGTRNDWVQVGGGAQSTFALDVNGVLWAVGYNGEGELGVGDTADRAELTRLEGRWAQFYPGNHHHIAVDLDGAAWGWGKNNCGQLGLPVATSTAVLQPTRIDSLGALRAISPGFHHTLVIDDRGRLFGFGCNFWGELGIGSFDGVDAEQSPHDVPVQIGATTDWTAISAGDFHSTGLRSDVLYTWGSNPNGQLGLGSDLSERQTEPTEVPSAERWRAVEAAWRHTAALTVDGRVFVFGGKDQAGAALGPQVEMNHVRSPSPVAIDGCQ